jgi:hypothetical protein
MEYNILIIYVKDAVCGYIDGSVGWQSEILIKAYGHRGPGLRPCVLFLFREICASVPNTMFWVFLSFFFFFFFLIYRPIFSVGIATG